MLFLKKKATTSTTVQSLSESAEEKHDVSERGRAITDLRRAGFRAQPGDCATNASLDQE
jgi:hypothetical protein